MTAQISRFNTPTQIGIAFNKDRHCNIILYYTYQYFLQQIYHHCYFPVIIFQIHEVLASLNDDLN